MSASSQPLAFEVAGLRLAYPGTVALDAVDLVVRPGEELALIGPSGAGKTSLLSVLNARLAPSAGSVRADGRELAELGGRELRALRRRIGHVPQELGLVPNLRVLQNVLAGALGGQGLLASLRSMVTPCRAELERVHALLDRLGVADKLYERVDSLSGGEQQRVAIARALYQEPRALLADEPLAALDPARSRETLRLFGELARERGLTLVLSLHDVALARELVPRLVGLRAGRVVFDRPAGEVQDEEVRALYGVEAED